MIYRYWQWGRSEVGMIYPDIWARSFWAFRHLNCSKLSGPTTRAVVSALAACGRSSLQAAAGNSTLAIHDSIWSSTWLMISGSESSSILYIIHMHILNIWYKNTYPHQTKTMHTPTSCVICFNTHTRVYFRFNKYIILCTHLHSYIYSYIYIYVFTNIHIYIYILRHNICTSLVLNYTHLYFHLYCICRYLQLAPPAQECLQNFGCFLSTQEFFSLTWPPWKPLRIRFSSWWLGPEMYMML